MSLVPPCRTEAVRAVIQTKTAGRNAVIQTKTAGRNQIPHRWRPMPEWLTIVVSAVAVLGPLILRFVVSRVSEREDPKFATSSARPANAAVRGCARVGRSLAASGTARRSARSGRSPLARIPRQCPRNARDRRH